MGKLEGAKTLAGKVALVTGGSRSLGAAIAKRLAADGAALAFTVENSIQSKAKTNSYEDTIQKIEW